MTISEQALSSSPSSLMMSINIDKKDRSMAVTVDNLLLDLSEASTTSIAGFNGENDYHSSILALGSRPSVVKSATSQGVVMDTKMLYAWNDALALELPGDVLSETTSNTLQTSENTLSSVRSASTPDCVELQTTNTSSSRCVDICRMVTSGFNTDGDVTMDTLDLAPNCVLSPDSRSMTEDAIRTGLPSAVELSPGASSTDSGISVGSPAPSGGKPMLPPCRVCGEKASGFHYGVNTCEACKGFFRRSLHRPDGYKCLQSGKCRITPGKRSSCAACRLARCLNLGMSRSAIKTGRYTHEKRARDIREVKSLQSPATSRSSSPVTADAESPRTTETTAAAAASTATVAAGPTASTDSLCEDIIHVLTAAYISSSHHTPDYLSKLPERENRCMEQRCEREQMFGSLKPLSTVEYNQIYESTGIDIDGRREMVKHLIPCMERAINKFITFAKMLPGFKELPIEDQITLVKSARFDCWILSSHQSVNTERMLYTNQMGQTVHRDDMIKLNNAEFVDEFYRVAGVLKKIKLRPTEIALLQGISILFADRCDLSSPAEVEQSQLRIVDALLFYLNKHCPADRLRFARMIHGLCELRQAVKNQELHKDQRFLRWPDIQFPPLVLEMWSS